MHILFMGTPEFALPSLRILLEHKYPVSAVVTAPDKPRGRGLKVGFSPIKKFALERGLPVLQPEQLKHPGFISEVERINPDLIIVVAFRILPPEVYTRASKGAFNLHASLLPKYRGAAPINWAIINGEQETGVTTFFLTEKVDTGSIILQARVRIGPDETAGESYDKLAEVGGEIVLQTVRLIELGKAQPRSQDDALATPAPKLLKKDCRIDWNLSSQRIHNFVRGLSPSPAAWTRVRGKAVNLYRTSLNVKPGRGSAPGTVLDVDKETLIVGTGDRGISILELQQEGRRRMPVAEFLRGFALKAGEKFE